MSVRERELTSASVELARAAGRLPGRVRLHAVLRADTIIVPAAAAGALNSSVAGVANAAHPAAVHLRRFTSSTGGLLLTSAEARTLARAIDDAVDGAAEEHRIFRGRPPGMRGASDDLEAAHSIAIP